MKMTLSSSHDILHHAENATSTTTTKHIAEKKKERKERKKKTRVCQAVNINRCVYLFHHHLAERIPLRCRSSRSFSRPYSTPVAHTYDTSTLPSSPARTRLYTHTHTHLYNYPHTCTVITT